MKMLMICVVILIFNNFSLSQGNHDHHKMMKDSSHQKIMNMKMHKVMKDSHQNMMNKGLLTSLDKLKEAI